MAALQRVECATDVFDAALDAASAFGAITGLFIGLIALTTLLTQPPNYAQVMAERINSGVAIGSLFGSFTGLIVFIYEVASL